MTGVVRRYLDAVAAQDWDSAAGCLAPGVRRVGPFGDVFEGRDPYLEYLRGLMPTLAAYRMDIHRIVGPPDGDGAGDGAGNAADVVLAQLAETVEMEGAEVRTEESLVFDVDGHGRISHIAIYLSQSPSTQP